MLINFKSHVHIRIRIRIRRIRIRIRIRICIIHIVPVSLFNDEVSTAGKTVRKRRRF